MQTDGVFTGFPVAALDFYEDLEADNSKAFWAAHKAVYDDCVRGPMLALLAELEPEFGTGKAFRPYRDVRFSKDKAPYKTHQGGFVQTAPGVGFYVQVDAAGLVVAGGFYAGSSAQVAAYRTAVDDERRGAQLEKLLRKLRRDGFEIGGAQLKTRPRGDRPRPSPARPAAPQGAHRGAHRTVAALARQCPHLRRGPGLLAPVPSARGVAHLCDRHLTIRESSRPSGT